MYEISSPFLEAACFGLLYFSALFLWVPKMTRPPLWVIALGLSIFLGWIGPTLNIVALIVIAVLVLVIYCLKNSKLPVLVRFLSAIALCILGGVILAHRVMGFDNILVLNKVFISKDGVPFSLYLNYDKTILGILILGILHQRISSRKEWFKMLKAMSWRAVIVILVVMLFAFRFKYVHFDFKIPRSILLFAVTNLFFVCLAEEAFFRGFIQKYLSMSLSKIKFGNAFAILVAATLFGAAHFGGGWHYMVLAGIAGVGYGWIYFRTQRIEASILAHFLLNMVHFVFFTYPALAR